MNVSSKWVGEHDYSETSMAWCSLLSKNDMQLLTGLLDYHVAKRRSVWPQSGSWLLRPLYMCGLSVVNNHFLMLTLSSVYDSVIYNTIQSSIHNLQSKRGSGYPLVDCSTHWFVFLIFISTLYLLYCENHFDATGLIEMVQLCAHFEGS